VAVVLVKVEDVHLLTSKGKKLMICRPLKWGRGIPARLICWRYNPPFRGKKIADLFINNFNGLWLS
jgi:hypothetical protein